MISNAQKTLNVTRSRDEITEKIRLICDKQRSAMIDVIEVHKTTYSGSVDKDGLELIKSFNESSLLLVDYLIYDSLPSQEEADDWTTSEVLPWLLGQTDILSIDTEDI